MGYCFIMLLTLISGRGKENVLLFIVNNSIFYGVAFFYRCNPILFLGFKITFTSYSALSGILVKLSGVVWCISKLIFHCSLVLEGANFIAFKVSDNKLFKTLTRLLAWV